MDALTIKLPETSAASTLEPSELKAMLSEVTSAKAAEDMTALPLEKLARLFTSDFFIALVERAESTDLHVRFNVPCSDETKKAIEKASKIRYLAYRGMYLDLPEVKTRFSDAEGILRVNVAHEPSMIFEPLALNGSRFGLVGVGRLKPGCFSERERERLEISAQVLSLALNGALLGERVKKLNPWSRYAGVHSRAYFEKQLGYEFDRAAKLGVPLSLISLRVKGLEAFAEELGEQAERDVIRKFSRFLRCLADRMDILGEYEKHEFCIIRPNTSLKNAVAFARRIAEESESRDFSDGALVLPLKVHAGVECFSNYSFTDPAALIESARSNMFRALGTGAGVVVPARRPVFPFQRRAS
ncbi:MAG: diguanylate cyclase [bacterium]